MRKSAFNFVDYKREYNKRMYKDIQIQLNREKDKDVIDFLFSLPNKKQFIVDLVRKYMEENK